MNVILQGDGSPFGVLEVDSRSEGEFGEHEIAFLLLVQACVLGLSAATGLALHWSSVIVAAVLGLAAIAAYAKAKAGSVELTPGRTIHQVNKDIAVAKEQFS